MDEGTLNDLLECSVCLERLDTSSRALPCQHTFCRKCLLEIYHKHKELRCPECRTLVNVKIDDLPPNVLLMRLLEGMKNSGLTTGPKTGQRSNRALPQQHAGTVQSSPQIQEQKHAERANNKHSVGYPVQHHAKALYDYAPKEAGELGFKRGDIIVLKRKIDLHWFQGECGGKQGLVPLSFVQIITPVPSHVPRCKALYDFRMNNDEEEGCLAFNKGDIINVIRRVDENWAEGKLDGRIGIFPLAFVELNSLARSLMKLSTNMQPGPSRVAPPTPTTEESTPLIPTDHSTALTHNISHQLLDSSVKNTSSSSSSTPNVTSSSNTSSGSSTAPSSPASPPSSSQPVGMGLRSNSRKKAQQQHQEQQHSSQGRSSHHHHSHHSKEKRHSLTNVTVVHPNSVHRHSAEFSTNQMPRPAEQAEGINRHTASSNDLQLPAPFMALYPYKPQKPDELELKKGGIYMVTEICQDGWFKGTSNRTQKCGVFPGNYVAPARGFPAGTATVVSSAHSGSSRLPVSCRSHTVDLAPPELPPRASTPPPKRLECAARSNNHTNVPTKSDKNKERKEKSTVSLMRRLASIKRSISPPPSSYSMDNPVFEDATAASSMSASTQPIHVRPVETSQGGSSGSSPDVHRHRKSNSLDASGQKSAKHNAPQTVRERFRCIAPYPPNSEYELELQLNDIIYVHKKRDDGWYKGTQQRTGKTGLFPASFVESF